ncbi:hypothetical protein [Yinghuangia soli]|uniref:Lipoprotein n=1 Tax=Yinghuangia soli TaxID=2908204 RepID=A0AA41Q1K9_9ACTN|nr:hypothetical protein [Yinghuangia soli]MCF2529879.1 hypothetical protein [Yinghuangia soli]
MRVRPFAIAASATALVVAGLAGCSEGKVADNTKLDAKVLADKAVAEMNKMRYVDAAAKGKTAEGVETTSALCADLSAKSLAGKGTFAGEAVEMVQVDDRTYSKGNGKMWAAAAGSADDVAATAAFEKALAGKFVQGKADPDAMVEFFYGDTNGVTKGDVMTFAGQQAVPLTKTSSSGGKTTYYIAAKGAPVILGDVEDDKDGARDETTYTKAAAKCEVKEPAKDQVIPEDEVEAALEAVADNTLADPKDLADRSREHALKQKSVALSGTGTDEDGTFTMEGCISYKADGTITGLKASMADTKGRKMEMIEVDGKSYMKIPTSAFIDAMGSAATPKAKEVVEKALGDKHLVADAEDGEEFDKAVGKVTKGTATTYQGKPAVELVFKATDGLQHLRYVAAEGAPVILGDIEDPDGKERVESVYKAFGGGCDVVAPPAAQVIEESQIEKALEDAARG